jgi:hypothetical protein
MAGSDPFAALPHALACHVFVLLSLQERARCAVVCRGWCTTLKDQSLWLRLDLSRADGAECSEAALRGAVARAGGQLQTLHLGCRGSNVQGNSLHGVLCAVVATNAGTLRELRVDKPSDRLGLRLTELEALLAAAPQLRVLHACAECRSAEEAHRLLRSEPPFAPLRLLEISVYNVPADAVLALAADVADCASLTGLRFNDVPLDSSGALEALVDAALARRLSSVSLYDCGLTPAAVPAISRLVAGDTLTALNLAGDDLLDQATAVVLGNALRANTSLTAFTYHQGVQWRDAAVGAALVDSLTGHSSIRMLELYWNCAPDDRVVQAVVGAALATLLLANAPALQTLDISYCGLGDEGMRPVVEALRNNTHLRTLNCCINDVNEAFARERLLPAVRANSSLRELNAASAHHEEVAAREAEALVAARTTQPEGAPPTTQRAATRA